MAAGKGDQVLVRFFGCAKPLAKLRDRALFKGMTVAIVAERYAQAG